jgi:hypothetical protein
LTTHLIISDPHAHYQHDNKRADYLAKLILDIKPDVVINGGDQWDMPSLSGYDKGKSSFTGRAVAKDLDAGLEFSERLWGPVKRAKKKMPRAVFLEGNHEERMKRMLQYSPEMEGTIGFKDFDLGRWYDDIVEYSGSNPGTINVDGITYAHYFVSGIAGRPISGEHSAYSLLSKNFSSCTAFHQHTTDYCVRTNADGRRIHGMVAGVYQDYDSDWAGSELCKLWWRGVVIKRNVENGQYDPQWVSLEALRKEYGD